MEVSAFLADIYGEGAVDSGEGGGVFEGAEDGVRLPGLSGIPFKDRCGKHRPFLFKK